MIAIYLGTKHHHLGLTQECGTAGETFYVKPIISFEKVVKYSFCSAHKR